MAENKTKPTESNVTDFLNALDSDQKKQDAFRLVSILQGLTGCDPHMWGGSIVGFGSYHYTYASGHQGDAPVLGFSPRKAEFSLYIYAQGSNSEPLLEKLGKFKMGKACIYVKKLADIDEAVLREIATNTIRYIADTYERTA
ncbi:MAG TPA: DUF1801 domain-containing protein [Flavobacterium sp.]|nr:DUF1801 domain-containing protein [Flavobacterium sp.]